MKELLAHKISEYLVYKIHAVSYCLILVDLGMYYNMATIISKLKFKHKIKNLIKFNYLNGTFKDIVTKLINFLQIY